MTTDELPVDVLTELGRVTWAAIKLEDYAKSICSFIQPSNPREDRRQISQKLKDATDVLKGWPDSSPRDQAAAWLQRAGQALERRNAMLHATPMVPVAKDGSLGPLFLGEMPRKNAPYTERALTVESLAKLRSVLQGAASGWRDLILAVGGYTRRR